jgi:hypothetical protein
MFALHSVGKQLQGTAQFVALLEVSLGVVPVRAQPADLASNVSQPL